MLRLTFLICLGLQACIFSKKTESGPCGDGNYEFTRFHLYDERDSTSAIFVVDNRGDTTSKDIFEYDVNGNLVRQVWIYKNLNLSGDTACWAFERIGGGKVIRQYPCDDSSKTTSLEHLDSLNRTARKVTYFQDSTVASEVKLLYNENNQIVKIMMNTGSGEYVAVINEYNEDGTWKEGVQYNSTGNILWKTTMTYESERRTISNVFDGDGKFSKWEVNYLVSKNRVEKSIACKP